MLINPPVEWHTGIMLMNLPVERHAGGDKGHPQCFGVGLDSIDGVAGVGPKQCKDSIFHQVTH